MKIKRKHLQRLVESLLFEVKRGTDGPTWNYSPDSDFPASALKAKTNMPLGKANKAITDPFYEALHSERALLLRPNDVYTLTPKIDTHGGESHALKHLAEVDPQLVLDTMNDCIVLLGQAVTKNEILHPIAFVDKAGNVGEVDILNVTPGDMLNTMDQIYDDQIIDGHADIADSIENRLVRRVKAMISAYDDRVDIMTGDLTMSSMIGGQFSMTDPVVDVSDANLAKIQYTDSTGNEVDGITTPKQLLDWFGQKSRNIVFAGTFMGGPRSNMYFDTANTEYVGTSGTGPDDERINTLMAKKKKPPTTWSQVFGDIGNAIGKDPNNTQIDPQTHSIFRAMVDGIKNNDPSLKPHPKLP